MTEWLEGIGHLLVGIGWVVFAAAFMSGRIKIVIGLPRAKSERPGDPGYLADKEAL